MLNDLRQGLRMLLKARGWTIVVVVSLALGIGANAALFSAANSVLLKTVPVRDPDTLVRLRYAGPNEMVTDQSEYGTSRPDSAGLTMRTTFSYPMFRELVAANRTMADLVACAPFGRVNMSVDGEAAIASVFMASGNYFRMLGVSAALGRTFGPEDDRPAAPPVAVVSDQYWRSRFGGSPAVIGKAVRINDTPVTIVGVLPAGFTGIQRAVAAPPDVTVLLALDSAINPGETRLDKPTYWWLQVVGRLRPDTTTAGVQAHLETVFQHSARAGLDSYLASLSDTERSASFNSNRSDVPHLRVDSAGRGIYDPNPTDTRALAILSGIVGLVLLIVCANVANLLLSRGSSRQKEISVKLSLGATRARLVRQLLTESLVLAFIGGGGGLLVGYWGHRVLPGVLGEPAPLDLRIVAFVMAITSLTALAFGIAPALRATGVDVNASLKENSRSVVGSRTLLARALVVAQVGISLVLLIGAGVFLRTVENLRRVDLGFDASNLVLFRVSPQLYRYDEARTAALYQEMLRQLGTIGGVRSAGLSQPALLSGSVNSTSIFVQGRSYAPEQRDEINRLIVSPSFLAMLEIPMLRGRGFTDHDTETAPKVAVINETAARKFFPDANPIGQHFGWNREASGDFEIVGVLRDTKYNSVREDAPPTMYVPFLQARTSNPSFVVRTAGDPMSMVGAIREAVKRVDPNLPLMNVSTQMEEVERRFVQEKLFARAYTLFGGLALALASIGLFGLMSYNVTRRTNEIGVRMALGAARHDVLQLIMRESMVLVAIGIALGTLVAIGAGRVVSSQLFGVSATDARAMTLATSIMLAVAAFAGYLPARRASRVDPMAALRDE